MVARAGRSTSGPQRLERGEIRCARASRGLLVLIAALLSCVGVAAVCPTRVAAQDASSFYFAGGLGRIATRYHPAYDNVVTGAANDFTNKADGLEAHFALGRDVFRADRVSLAVEASASVNDENWSLFIPPEPAVLDFRLPYALALNAIPEIAITDRLGIAVLAGGGFGRVHEVKTSPTTSAYDYDELEPFLSLGGEIALGLTSRTDVFVRYRHHRYSTYKWDSTSPSGGLVEHVRDNPRSHAFWMGVAARF
jgi:hypothetical protein